MLSSPMEFLEIYDGESMTFHITNYLHDQGIIRPAHAPGGKAIDMLRVFVPADEKEHFPYYWDITGQGAIAQIKPILDAGGYQNKTFKLSASGVGPKKRYAVEVV